MPVFRKKKVKKKWGPGDIELSEKGLLRGVVRRSERQREILGELFPEEPVKRKKKKKGNK